MADPLEISLTDILATNYDWSDPRLVAIYDELPLWSAMFVAMLLEQIALRPDTRLLDIACGTGVPLVELAQRLGSTCRAVGIDPWNAALRRVQQKISLMEIGNLTLVDGIGETLPFQSGSFTLVTSNLGINNVADPPAALKEVRRVLVPGGRLALTTNLSGTMIEFYDVFAEIVKESGNDELLANLQAHMAHRGTVESTWAMLEAAGFKVSGVYLKEFSLRYLDGSAMLRHFLMRRGFLHNWKKLFPEGMNLEFLKTLEERLNQRAAEKGCLEVTIPMAYLEAEA
jgi:arsenite methyltransferase